MKLFRINGLAHNIIPMSYAEFLRKTRTAAGLTQGQLAQRVSALGHNITVSAISNIERRQYIRRDGSELKPHKQFVILAAKVCGADVSEALRAADYAPQDQGIDISLPDGLRINLLGGGRNWSDEDRQEFIRALETAYEIAKLPHGPNPLLGEKLCSKRKKLRMIYNC